MAKKKAAKPETPKTAKPNGFVLRTSDEWREWAKRLADYDNMTSLAALIEKVLADHARKVGMTERPPKR